MRSFTVERGNDETGLSGTGIVIEGVEFSTGEVVLRWMTNPYSIVHWPNFEAFKKICIDGHPSNNTVVEWSDGERFIQVNVEAV